MILRVFVVLCLTYPILSMSKVTISKQYLFSPQMLENLENLVQSALNRNEEMQNYLFAQVVDSNNHITLYCPPHQPLNNGSGCFLNFSLKFSEGGSLIIRKALGPFGKAQEVKDKLASLNPNSSEDHLQFGTIFDPIDSDASKYYCEPSGQTENKIWSCFLHVSEWL